MTAVFRTLAEENDPFVYLDVTDVLLRILDNILKAPDNPKYRTLRLENEIVSRKILPTEGAAQCLLHFGFKKTDEAFVMPQTVPVTKLQTIRNELDGHKKTFLARISSDSFTFKESTVQNPMFEEIRSYSKRVLLYEKKELQEAARNAIPLDELRKRVDQKKSDKMDDLEKEFGLLYETMMWFKNEFFTWMDKPKCNKCNAPETIVFQGMSTNQMDLVNTDRVEVYRCQRCGERLIFPRYNNPAVLLKTRTGRCGEWANCFTLICRALSYDARYVHDKTDHVWTEVYSNSQKRWIHCDPCEGQLDAPLVYESGWNKRLTYVLAFSKDEVQDVTWRYTAHFSDVLARRRECSEGALLKWILDITKYLQMSLPSERKRFLLERRLRECVEFLTPPRSDKEYGGRSSGSLQWRLSRAECQMSSQQCTWQPNETELERKRFRIRYSSATDKYHRVETDETITGWQTGVYECESVFRKVEHDWKQSYLCRTDDQSVGSVKWKFCTRRSGTTIDKVLIRYRCSLFHKGSVKLILCNDETCIPVDPKQNVFETDEFRGSHDLSLTAVMDADGRSPGSWQHAQLFRQSISDSDYPFEIDITLREGSSKTNA